jgi:protein-S-isoprenylcysteine O-methyltransferase Ste14
VPHTPHPALASALLVPTALVAAVVEVRQAGIRRDGASDQDRGSRVAIAVAFLAGYGLASLAVHAAPAADVSRRGVVIASAVLVIWSGLALRWSAFRALGRYFTFSVMTSSDQTVVTTGPYRLLRHPGYAGLLLAMVGGGLAFGNWLSLACLVVIPLVGVVYRIRVEEAALLAAVGEDYRAYASGRKRIIPFVW